jgi:two-component system, OmpR family, alkaline phosphatase synthesis response regulator PhoP
MTSLENNKGKMGKTLPKTAFIYFPITCFPKSSTEIIMARFYLLLYCKMVYGFVKMKTLVTRCFSELEVSIPLSNEMIQPLKKTIAMVKTRANQIRVLVADDDRDILTLLKIGLETAGFTVLISFNAENIYNIIQNNRPDIILLDITMINIDGVDICKTLKLSPQTKFIPVIMISANHNGESIANECGANYFISKPFQMAALEKMIGGILHL